MQNNIKVKEFEYWLEKEHEICFASSRGSGSDKDLFVNQYNKIKVRDHGFIVYDGRNIVEAVKIYNSCK